MRSWVRDHPVAAYVAIAYGFSWACWLPLVADAHGVASVPWTSHVPGLVGPMLAAFAITAVNEGKPGTRGLARSCVRLPTWRWLLAATGPLMLFVVAVVVTRPFRGGFRWSDLSRFEGLPSAAGPIGVLVLLVAVNGLGEEAGWRGFLQPTLQRDRPVRAATLTVTAIWAAWHAPLFLLDTGLGAMPGAMIPVWLVALMAGAVVLAWMTNHTGSVLAAAVWHGTYNWVSATDAATPAVGALVTAGVIVTALVVVRRDPGLGSGCRSPDPTGRSRTTTTSERRALDASLRGRRTRRYSVRRSPG